jgi:HlyD family secretion protein
VKAVHVDFNAQVKAGQVLVELDPAQLTAALDQSRAQLLAARADVKNREATAIEARLAAERTQALVTDGLASKQALEGAQAAAGRASASVDSARAQVIVSQASVDSNATALSKTQIRSPIDGVVLSRDVEVGQTLAVAMTTPVLFKVARDLREMEVTISIDEADVGHTQSGQQARFNVDAWPGRTFPGELASIHNVAVTRDNVVTYEALLRVRNDESLLRPGMTATVTIETDARKQVLLVPNAALRFRPPEKKKLAAMGPPEQTGPVVSDVRPRVYVLRNAEPVEQLVEVGLTDGVHTEVRGEGLAERDLVIVDAQQEGVP